MRNLRLELNEHGTSRNRDPSPRCEAAYGMRYAFRVFEDRGTEKLIPHIRFNGICGSLQIIHSRQDF